MTDTIMTAVWHSSFLGRQVIHAESAQKLGHITELWIDLVHHQVLGFCSRVDRWDRQPQTYRWHQVVITETQQVQVKVSPVNNLCLLQYLEPGTWTAVGDRIELEVLTQAGEWVGQVRDYCFDPETGNITAYLGTAQADLDAGPKRFCLMSDMIADAGRGWLLVNNHIGHRLKLNTDVSTQPE